MQLDMSVEEAQAGRRRWVKRLALVFAVYCALIIGGAFVIPTPFVFWWFGAWLLVGVVAEIVCLSAIIWHHDATFYARGYRDGKAAR